jgi:GTP-binding protein
MPERERQRLIRMIREYILTSENLVCLFLLVDIRLEMQRADREFLQFLGKNQVPFVIVFTKADKIPRNKIDQKLEHYKSKMLEKWESLPEIFLSSALKNQGRDEILDFIRKTLDEK